MTSWILMPVHNNLSLTRKAIDTCLCQDVGEVGILVINNASVDGTTPWVLSMHRHKVFHIYKNPPLSVAASWNKGLQLVFATGVDHCLVVNNDVELLPCTYRMLLDDGGGFVTAVSVKEREKLDEWFKPPDMKPEQRPHPDFSCYPIRKEVYQKVGPFDELFEGAFCEDWDYHVRMHKAGIYAHCIDVPFYHVGSATINSMPEDEAKVLQEQAARNREYFKEKWGMGGASKEYYDFFNPSSHSH